MAEIKINVTSRMLKRCAQENGDLLITLDVDPTKLEGFPQAFEVPLRSGKWDKHPNYNSKCCLMENAYTVYVYDEPYSLSDAAYRAIKAVYSEPRHTVKFQLFAQRYKKNDDEIVPEEANQVAQSATTYANKYFEKKKIPLRFKRVNGNVVLVMPKGDK